MKRADWVDILVVLAAVVAPFAIFVGLPLLGAVLLAALRPEPWAPLAGFLGVLGILLLARSRWRAKERERVAKRAQAAMRRFATLSRASQGKVPHLTFVKVFDVRDPWWEWWRSEAWWAAFEREELPKQVVWGVITARLKGGHNDTDLVRFVTQTGDRTLLCLGDPELYEPGRCIVTTYVNVGRRGSEIDVRIEVEADAPRPDPCDGASLR